MVENRRGTDTFSNLTERELLIQQQSILAKLGTDVHAMRKSNASEHEKLLGKIERIAEGKISNKLFFWVVGIIVLVIMGIASYLGDLSHNVTSNSAKVQNLYDDHKNAKYNGTKIP